ncbi:MAG: hypothetical protein JW910_05070 [Anaerolineae bacterium]|nr:hypothetical protein [Anaerolineae bacterium]
MTTMPGPARDANFRLKKIRPQRSSTVLTVLLILALLLPLAPIRSAQAQGGGTLRLAVRPIAGVTDQAPIPDPVQLAPDDLDARDLIENLYTGLFRYDAVTHLPVPVLVESWAVGADGMMWTFTLRQDVQWVSVNPDSGEVTALRPVVAQDFVTAILRACNPLKPSPASTAIYAIEGCYTAAQSNPLLVTDELVESWVGIAALDSTTLVMRLAFPLAYLPSLLTQPEFRPVPREFLNFTPAWPMLAANGPYVLADWRLGESLVLVRNPLWPADLGAGGPERVELTFMAEGAARAEAFLAGDADVTRLGASGPSLTGLETVQVRRGSEVTLLGFATERAFVSEVGVRQALAWAIDRDALAAANPLYVSAPTLTAPGLVAGPPESVGVGYEPDAARAALAEAGFSGCSAVPEVIRLVVSGDDVPLAEQIVAGWTQTLGCGPDLFAIVPTPASTIQGYARGLVDAENTIRPHLWLTTWRADTMDANSGAGDAFHCLLGYFYSGLACGPQDELIDLAGTVAGAEERPDIYARIEARLFGPAGLYPAVPLLAAAEYVGVGAGVRGVGDFGPAWWPDYQL